MEEGEYYLLFFFGGISLSSFSVFSLFPTKAMINVMNTTTL